MSIAPLDLSALERLPLLSRVEDGQALPMLLWVPGRGRRMISSAPPGGGIGERRWVLNAQVAHVPGPRPAGTINIIVSVPVAFSDAALVNAVATATEAKVQALRDAGADASGTPTDAVCVAALRPSDGHPVEPFAGPRSVWGARPARAVHEATLRACLRSGAPERLLAPGGSRSRSGGRGSGGCSAGTSCPRRRAWPP
ncbi:adenosylcobinamide amidohydrolase, partial [Streptomyces sp. NPDC057939]|uniref:adenosylcobinamide amidohydrolase n=1 Tax=Streptomyces sp. NPDC057939 TaxID=3346284 RepID=UPI0036ECCD1B